MACVIRITNIPLPLDDALNLDERALTDIAADVLGVRVSSIKKVDLAKKSIDARKDIHFVIALDVELSSIEEPQLLAAKDGLPKGVQIREIQPYTPLDIPQCTLGPDQHRPIVVGAGPAGLFAALYLAKAGLCPLVIEQGAPVDQREEDVARFLETGVLDTHSNIQFGEGGAGTFSDGKLTTNIKGPYVSHVLHWFVEAGADPEILVNAHPHLGSDRLPTIVKNLRQQIEELGGSVRFYTELVGLQIKGGKLTEVQLRNTKDGLVHTLPADTLIIACGHSARPLFSLLQESGLAMEPKPFSVGVRIEHPQALINQSQWGRAAGHPALDSAEYKLALHLPSGRHVYTFCMCPGGEVVAAASEEGGIVTNGMSRYARAGSNANAALLVNVDPSDLSTSNALAGVDFQRAIEQAAFVVAARYGGNPYQAPVQTVGAFLAENPSLQSSAVQPTKYVKKGRMRHAQKHYQPSFEPFDLEPTYGRGTVTAPISECLPQFVTQSLSEALPVLDKKLQGFAHPSAIMTAPETRSSSPVRVKRNGEYQAYLQDGRDPTFQETGIYPCGEGPGYAGGIMSAAVDGMRVAAHVCLR